VKTLYLFFLISHAITVQFFAASRMPMELIILTTVIILPTKAPTRVSNNKSPFGESRQPDRIQKMCFGSTVSIFSFSCLGLLILCI
jgi:hypothetical protein